MALGSSGRPSSRKRQASKRFGPNPERRSDFRNCFGMIWSVSTLTRSRGATSAVSTLNLSISSPPATHVDEVSRHRGRGGHFRAHKMGAAARALPSLEIAVRGRGAALARLQAIGVHAQAHRAPRFAPLEAGVLEDAVEALGFRLSLHQPRARYDQGELDVRGDAPS